MGEGFPPKASPRLLCNLYDIRSAVRSWLKLRMKPAAETPEYFRDAYRRRFDDLY